MTTIVYMYHYAISTSNGILRDTSHREVTANSIFLAHILVYFVNLIDEDIDFTSF